MTTTEELAFLELLPLPFAEVHPIYRALAFQLIDSGKVTVRKDDCGNPIEFVLTGLGERELKVSK